MTVASGSVRVDGGGPSGSRDGDRLSAGEAEPTLSQLFSRASKDLSTLVSQEIRLAKVELKDDAVAAGTGAGMFGAAAVLGVVAFFFLSVALVYGLHGLGLPLGVSWLIVGAVYLLVAAVLALLGKRSIGRMKPPRRTISTLKDDLAWAKHPTSPPPATGH